MSLSQYNLSSQLTTNAKAQGRKLTLKVVMNLDTDRSDWVSDVVIKMSLIGTHDTLRICWTPVDHETILEITGSKKKQINSSALKGKMSSSSSIFFSRKRFIIQLRLNKRHPSHPGTASIIPEIRF